MPTGTPAPGRRIPFPAAYPNELSAKITVQAKRPSSLSLFFRTDRVDAASVNGNPASLERKDGYAVLSRTWSDGDEIVLRLQSSLQLVPLRGDNSRAAVRYGDVLLAQKGALPLLYDGSHRLEELLSRQPGETLAFLLHGENGTAAELVPLYEIDKEEYTVYCRTTAQPSSQVPFREAADGKGAYQTEDSV